MLANYCVYNLSILLYVLFCDCYSNILLFSAKICSPVEYSELSSDNQGGLGVPGRKTIIIVTDGVLIYWLYYWDVSSQTMNQQGSVNQSGSTSGSNSTFGVVEVNLEVLELKVWLCYLNYILLDNPFSSLIVLHSYHLFL